MGYCWRAGIIWWYLIVKKLKYDVQIQIVIVFQDLIIGDISNWDVSNVTNILEF